MLSAQSYCDWWSLAGVDALVGETPANWLAAAPANDLASKPGPAPRADAETPPIPAALQRPAASQPAVHNAPRAYPDNWADFQQLLATGADVPGCQWDLQRILPVGELGAPMMILTAWPEIDDQRDGTLFAGAAGNLLDAMLQAIGLTRADCYVASLAVTRPPGGRCDAEAASELDRLLWHHLALARPRRLLLVGSDIVRMAVNFPMADARGRLLDLNQGGDKVESVAIPHPALLLARPIQKAAAWDSLKLFNRGR